MLSPILILSLILVFVLVFLLIFHFWPATEEIVSPRKLRRKRRRGSKETLTLFLTNVLRHLGDLLTKIKLPIINRERERIKELLSKAGTPGNLSADDFLTIKILLFLGLPLIAKFFFPNLTLIWMLGLAIFGYWFPSRMIRDRISRRHRLIVRHLPDTLDLLILSVEAGLDFGAALAKVVEKAEKNPLLEEFFLMEQEMRMGKIRTEALRDMAQRVGQPDLTSVINALVQAEQLGTSLGPILRVQAEQMRTRRFQLAEKLAAEAPIKMLFPLLAFIFPCVFIMLFGPIILQIIGGGLFR